MKKCYNETAIAYFDILGFTEMIEIVQNDNEEAIKQINFISKTIEKNIKGNIYKGDLENKDYGVVKYKIFSDNFCLSLDNFDTYDDYDKCYCINNFLVSLCKIQAELALKKIFIRGAITINKHYQDSNMIFSKALIDVYSMENKKAKFPRIIIDNPIIETLAKVNSFDDDDLSCMKLNKILKNDADTLTFLDYIGAYNYFDGTIKTYLEGHKNAIVSSLEKELNKKNKASNKFDPNIIHKLLWIANYHNYKVEDFNKRLYDLKNIKIEDKYLQIENNVFPMWIIFAFNLKNNDNFIIAKIKANDEFLAKEKLYHYFGYSQNSDFDKINFYLMDFVYEKELLYKKINDVQTELKSTAKVIEL